MKACGSHVLNFRSYRFQAGVDYHKLVPSEQVAKRIDTYVNADNIGCLKRQTLSGWCL